MCHYHIQLEEILPSQLAGCKYMLLKRLGEIYSSEKASTGNCLWEGPV